MSKRILNAEEINELLGRLKKGESNELIENQMNISSSTLSNFRAYFISQGHDLSASATIKETASSTSNCKNSRPLQLQHAFATHCQRLFPKS